ncbi:MAG: potassium transporter TrkG [Tunicatimonas sp.]|uniref:TrkH family potassium uptake protein n=1 Tax=Tunicatimonas sp. TaxID=1940096 RepID=UPI003C70DFE0
MSAFSRFIGSINPYMLLMLGYVSLMIVGSILLALPFVHEEPVSFLDALFTAISAVSTTGLITVSTPDSYNLAGEIIIILLIQIGGIGYMSLASFVVLASRRKLSTLGESLIKTDFSLPEGFSIIDFIRSVVIFAFSIEAIGAVILFILFWQADTPDALWQAIFHSISAFCTAGFSLFNNSLEDFKFDFWINLVITLLALGGSIGFIVFSDIYLRITGRKEHLTFTSRIILRFTLVFVSIGSFIVFLTESQFAGYSPENSLLVSIFQVMTASTTVGFNTYAIGDLSSGVLFLIIIMMLSGASPSGTGGGIKSTTITALYAVMVGTLRGKENITFANRTIPPDKVRLAATNFFFYIIVLGTGIFLLSLVEEHPIFEVIFEATSALGTVGLSTGITGALTPLGKLLIIMLMFLGRVGPITFGLALMKTEQTSTVKEELGDIVI